jgi:ADP-dependent phosphofructokinase/glucokinase
LKATEWNIKYLESIDFAEEKLPKVKGVIACYNSNLDAVVRVKENDLEKVLKSDPMLAENIVARIGKPLKEISCKEDFLVGLLNCMRSGIGEELLISNDKVCSWIKSVFGTGDLRMGGQAGNVANTLAKLGVSNVIVHVSSLSKLQASFFLDNVKIPVNKNGLIILEKPINAIRHSDATMFHYVFEFDKGTSIKIGEFSFHSPRANRFVATWDPKNTELDIHSAFLRLTVRDNADRAIISGLHLLRRSYERDYSFVDKIGRVTKHIEKWKQEDPDFFVHFEMGDNKDEEIYKTILISLAPYINSLGLNEDELLKALVSLRHNRVILKKPLNSITIFEIAKKILDALKIPMILVHTLDFSLCIVKRGENYKTKNVEDVQKAIMFGALLAAVKAITGDYSSLSEVKMINNSQLLQLSERGLMEHEQLSAFLEKSFGSSQIEFLNKGHINLDDCFVIFVPSKLTGKPVTTAGLGDSLVSGYILGVK